MGLVYKKVPHPSCLGNQRDDYKTDPYLHKWNCPIFKETGLPNLYMTEKSLVQCIDLIYVIKITLHINWLGPQEITLLLHKAGSSSESSLRPLTGSDPQSTSLSHTQSRGIHFWLF